MKRDIQLVRKKCRADYDRENRLKDEYNKIRRNIVLNIDAYRQDTEHHEYISTPALIDKTNVSQTFYYRGRDGVLAWSLFDLLNIADEMGIELHELINPAFFYGEPKSAKSTE